jgi:hypothetical protein
MNTSAQFDFDALTRACDIMRDANPKDEPFIVTHPAIQPGSVLELKGSCVFLMHPSSATRLVEECRHHSVHLVPHLLGSPSTSIGGVPIYSVGEICNVKHPAFMRYSKALEKAFSPNDASPYRFTF